MASAETYESDWRPIRGYYAAPEGAKCCVCGSTYRIGIDPRFSYLVCDKHALLSPVQISEQRTDGK